ncbi:TPA_asm: lipoate--protein ligase, partial [Listeria monocytogenes]|nr:lipoate--protein ligase [Listeria monocytogenes]
CRFERKSIQNAWQEINAKDYFGGIEKEAILDMLFE